MKKHPPAFQFYANDFMDLTRLWDAIACGLHVRCMCVAWTHGSIPSDLKVLARAIHCDVAEIEAAWPTLSEHWQESESGGLIHAPLEAVRQRQKEVSSARKLAAEKRWFDANADANADANRMQMQMQRKEKEKEKEKEEVVSEISEKKKETNFQQENNAQLESEINARGSTNDPGMGPSTTPTENVQHDQKEATSRPPKKQPDPLPFTSDRFAAAWTRWETSRRESRKPITPTARSMQLAKCAQWGEDRAIAALDHSAANGYQGLFEPTHKSEPPKKDINKGIIKHGDKIETTWM